MCFENHPQATDAYDIPSAPTTAEGAEVCAEVCAEVGERSWYGPLRKVARPLLATILSPVATIVWMALLVMMGWASPFTYPVAWRWRVMVSVLLLVVCLPLLLLISVRFIRRKVQKGKPLDERTKMWEQRALMLMVAIGCYYCGVSFSAVPILLPLRSVLYSAVALTFVAAVCDYIRPLALHSFGFGGVVGILWLLLAVGNGAMYVPFLIVLLLSGVVLSLRLLLFGRSLRYEVLSFLAGALLGPIAILLV